MAKTLPSPIEDRGTSGFPLAPNMGQIIGDRFGGVDWQVRLEIQSSGLLGVCVCSHMCGFGGVSVCVCMVCVVGVCCVCMLCVWCV